MEHIFRIVDFNVYNGKDSSNESSDDEQNTYKDTIIEINCIMKLYIKTCARILLKFL